MSTLLTRTHESAIVERFQQDPSFAAEYLDAIIHDGDEGELLQTLQRIAEAFSGVGQSQTMIDEIRDAT